MQSSCRLYDLGLESVSIDQPTKGSVEHEQLMEEVPCLGRKEQIFGMK